MHQYTYRRITGISWGLKSYEMLNFCDFFDCKITQQSKLFKHTMIYETHKTNCVFVNFTLIVLEL